jgi:hypothetical protein
MSAERIMSKLVIDKKCSLRPEVPVSAVVMLALSFLVEA